MMLVAALVMQPGRGVADVVAFAHVGAAIALVILRSHDEFRAGILGQIVGQALPVQAHPEAVAPDQTPVLRDGLKVLPAFHAARFLSLFAAREPGDVRPFFR